MSCMCGANRLQKSFFIQRPMCVFVCVLLANTFVWNFECMCVRDRTHAGSAIWRAYLFSLSTMVSNRVRYNLLKLSNATVMMFSTHSMNTCKYVNVCLVNMLKLTTGGVYSKFAVPFVSRGYPTLLRHRAIDWVCHIRVNVNHKSLRNITTKI
jgi:hypothetical protein